MNNHYEWADNLIDLAPRYNTGFTQLLSTGPYSIALPIWEQYRQRLSLIQSFQNNAVKIFRASLRNDTDPQVLHWLINETPKTLGINYHRRLDDCHYTTPVFFRTDEAVPGRIIEIQCPGSLWGSLQLVFNYSKRLKKINHDVSPSEHFSFQLTDFLQKQPIVHHLLDNASIPSTTRYFIECTRPTITYWSIDKNIKQQDCNFIRSHSFFGLCSENEFKQRLGMVGKGVTYDLPPHVLFDQKATLVLPFWSLTRDLFSDEIRNIFVFTTPILPQGIELPGGQLVSIEDFAKLSRSNRSYYLKYAGSDVALNWGSKAVYRLSNMSSEACLILLQKCISQYNKGKIWLLQKEEKQYDTINFINRDQEYQSKKLSAKFSAFYGPTNCAGVLAMHRHHYKVHGQADTIISYVVSENDLIDSNS